MEDYPEVNMKKLIVITELRHKEGIWITSLIKEFSQNIEVSFIFVDSCHDEH